MLTATYTDALEIRQGRNAWRITGRNAARLFACARSMAGRGKGPGRVLGRCLNGHYGVTVERTATETADEKRRRELREDPGSSAGFAAELERIG